MKRVLKAVALFVGDSADGAADGALHGSPWIFSDSQPQNRGSLVDLERQVVADGLSVQAIVPSHSGVTDGSAALATFARVQR
jgi:hypothetical protein